MRVGKGIPLPVNIESSGLTCVQLYIPTDDEGMYIQALAGAFSQMGKWNYWQKDGTNRGAQVAEIWREAIDLTYEEAWLNGVFMSCADIQSLVDAIGDLTARLEASQNGIANAIRALELTTVPLDCIPCGDRVETPPPTLPDPDPENPPVGTTPTEWETYLCRGANYLWYEHVMRGGSEFVLLASTGGSLISVGAVLAILYASGIGAPIAFAGTIITTIIAIAITYDQTTLEAELERLAEPMICAITSSTGTASALQAMRDTLVAEGADQDIIDYIMAVTGTNALNKLFNGEIVVPDEFVEPYDCSSCGEELPSLGAGWHWIENTITLTSLNTVDGNAVVTHTFDGNEVSVIGNGGVDPNSSGWNVNVDYHADLPLEIESAEYMGMLVDYKHIGSAGANAGGWLRMEYLLYGGDGASGNITPLDEDVTFGAFYGKNVNSGTEEHDVMSAIIDSIGGYFAGNIGGTEKFTVLLAYYDPWVTVNCDVTIKTWSLYREAP